jgi:hypothetical protein
MKPLPPHTAIFFSEAAIEIFLRASPQTPLPGGHDARRRRLWLAGPPPGAIKSQGDVTAAQSWPGTRSNSDTALVALLRLSSIKTGHDHFPPNTALNNPLSFVITQLGDHS